MDGTPIDRKGELPPDMLEESAKKPLRVSLVVYVISLIVVALVVFIVMLSQYLHGYRSYYRLSQMVKNSNVEFKVDIPMSEVRKRDINPFTEKQEKSIVETFKDMGAKTVSVTITTESKGK